MHLIGRPFQPAEEAADAIPLRIVFALHVAWFAVLDEFTVGGGKFLPRDIERNGRLPAGAYEIFLRLTVDVTLERCDRAFGERQGWVWDDLIPVEPDDATEAAALRAGTHGRIEREECGRGWAELTSVDWRFQGFAVAGQLLALVVEQAEAGAAEAEGREGRFMEARGLVGRDGDAVLDDEQFDRVGGNLVFR